VVCSAFVLGGFATDAEAKRRRRRKSRAVRKAEAERKKAELEAKKADEQRKKAESEAAAAEAQLKAEKARIQLENLRKSGSTGGEPTPAAADKSAAAVPAGSPGAAPLAGAKDITPREQKPLWGGFFLEFNIGYGSTGGANSPRIPNPASSSVSTVGGPEFLYAASPSKYAEAVTTDVGGGIAVNLQIGYNIMGYASLWADLSAHGSFGAKSDTAGAGTIALMLGFHPLRFVRNGQFPVDVRLYGGYGFFEILGYHETVFQTEATGKSWTGTAIPFGLSGEYRIPESVFAIGLDLRMVRATYDTWIYNFDDDLKSDLTLPGYAPTTVTRFEPRVVFGWHF